LPVAQRKRMPVHRRRQHGRISFAIFNWDFYEGQRVWSHGVRLELRSQTRNHVREVDKTFQRCRHDHTSRRACQKINRKFTLGSPWPFAFMTASSAVRSITAPKASCAEKSGSKTAPNLSTSNSRAMPGLISPVASSLFQIRTNVSRIHTSIGLTPSSAG